MKKPRPKAFTAFVRDVGRVQLSAAQRVLCSVAFDRMEPRDLPPAERELAVRLFGPVGTIPPEARSVLVAVCGARSGKSRIIAALYSLWRALTADLTALAPGEMGVALLVAPDMRLGRQTLRFALGAAQAEPTIAKLIKSESSDGFVIERQDGRRVSVECLPATRGGSALRGRSLVSAVLDEAAFFRDAEYAVNDEEIYRAVAPRVLTGGMVVIASTPWAEAGLLFDEFNRNHGHPITALAAHAPTDLMNPSKAAEVARERERDPDNARREFDAEFMAMGSGLFFDSAAIDRALALGDAVPPRWTGTGAIGGDLGLVRDASAFVAVHESESFFDVADIIELRPAKGAPLRLSEVCKSGAQFAQAHGATSIYVDHHVLEPAREHMPDDLWLDPVDGGQNAKAERHVTVRNLLNEGRLRIPRQFQRLANQLREVVSRPTAGGGLQISMPRRAGVHGDVTAAFVLSVHAAARGACDSNTVEAPSPYSDEFEELLCRRLEQAAGENPLERAAQRLIG